MGTTSYSWLIFVVMTVVCWGCYVPVLHEGQKQLGDGTPGKGSIRAFLLVGAAYFVVAVLVPLGLLFGLKWEMTTFSAGGTGFAFLGGLLGAVGALGIILAMRTGNSPLMPLLVPALVFAGAPVVNVLVAIYWHRDRMEAPPPLFFVGIVLAAVGAGLVLYNKPKEIKRTASPAMGPARSTATPAA